MTHTPGPWTVDDNYIMCRYDGNGNYICRMLGRGEETDANARLIAAAPDMAARIERLETEKAAIAEIADHLKNKLYVGVRYPGRMDDIRWDVEKIAAIAKAEVTE